MFVPIAWITAFLTWILISFGALVRLKGAGWACPDWPLCYGQIIPPPGLEIALEVGHRFVASGVGLLILILLWLSWKTPALKPLFKLAFATTVLVIVQGILGGLTVIMQLWPPVVTFHLIGGNLVFAFLIYMAYVAKKRLDGQIPQITQLQKRMGILILLLLLIMTSGGINSTTYSGYACEAFPGCHEGSFLSFGASGKELGGVTLEAVPAEIQGQFLPVHPNEWIHMTHRFLAIFGGILLIVLALRWMKRHPSGQFRREFIAFKILIILEMGVGITNAVYRIPVPVSALHTAIAATMIGILSYAFAKASYYD